MGTNITRTVILLLSCPLSITPLGVNSVMMWQSPWCQPFFVACGRIPSRPVQSLRCRTYHAWIVGVVAKCGAVTKPLVMQNDCQYNNEGEEG